MESFQAVIEALGGPPNFAAAIRVTVNHARVMKSRNSIPAEYWHPVVEAAAAKGIPEITHETLAKLAARRRTIAA